MQIVIDINEEMYAQIMDENGMDTMLIPYESIVKNGTPLPKGHGRIKDIDKIEWYGCTDELHCPYKDRECKDCHRAECSKTQVDDLPTIIEADKAESEDRNDTNRRR